MTQMYIVNFNNMVVNECKPFVICVENGPAKVKLGGLKPRLKKIEKNKKPQ